jgi:hypothetical protein
MYSRAVGAIKNNLHLLFLQQYNALRAVFAKGVPALPHRLLQNRAAKQHTAFLWRMQPITGDPCEEKGFARRFITS